MATTPFPNLGSTNILSAHLNGVQQAINRLEGLLDPGTVAKSGQAMTPVTDQVDPSFHYTIYFAAERNWLNSPNPVIYRNGTPVAAGEYDLLAAYGAVVFHSAQSAGDTITADYTRLALSSSVLNQITQDISDRATLAQLAAVQAQLGGIGGAFPSLYASGSYISNVRRNITWMTTPGSHDSSDVVAATGITTPASSMDIFPMALSSRTTFDQVAMKKSSGSPTAMRVIVYKDDGTGAPGEMAFTSPDFSPATNAWGYATINETLDPGLYWIARQQDSAAYWDGLEAWSCLTIPEFDATGLYGGGDPLPNVYGGYRVEGLTFSAGAPDPCPATPTDLMEKAYYCPPWLVVA